MKYKPAIKAAEDDLTENTGVKIKTKFEFELILQLVMIVS
jgi:hypothetical protein